MLNIKLPWYTTAWIWIRTHWYVPVSAMLLVIAWLLSRAAGARDPQGFPTDSGIDRRLAASRAKAEGEIHAAQVRTNAEIEEVERQHAVAVGELETAQRAEYDAVRASGPKAVEKWLNNELARRGL